jgi:6-pyruvoyltetrahydropterin/6-carboxytetrahydropterin synthase
MLLTVSKRLEFSASRRLFLREWSEEENVAAFGPETRARYGTGRNYTVYFIFTGRVDPVTGMLINISEIKERAGRTVDDRFDHKLLNEDNPAFTDVPPTAENIARQLYVDVAPLFADTEAALAACHVIETTERSATFYSSGACEGNYWFEFSAARQTMSPLMSAAENEKLFGSAASLHGHNYRARMTLRSEKFSPGELLVQQRDINACIESLRYELDRRYLNTDIAAFKNRPMTTESLASYMQERAARLVPLHRLRLHERADFFAEAWVDGNVFLGMQMPFSAAHRLHVATFSDEQNVALFGKCDNPRGHGHTYVAEATLGSTYDERSGTIYDFVAFQRALQDSLVPWQDRHLDLETDDFREQPSTGENIVRTLWPKIDSRVGQQLVRLRLWETANNRFTLRRM